MVYLDIAMEVSIYMSYFFQEQEIIRIIYCELSMDEAEIIMAKLKLKFPEKHFYIDVIHEEFSNINLN